MDTLADSEMVEAVVRKALRASFPKVKVVDVTVQSDEDDDGENVVNIMVVIQAKKADLDPKAIPAFVRKVIEALKEEKEDRFPLFNFVSKSDLGKMKSEAA